MKIFYKIKKFLIEIYEIFYEWNRLFVLRTKYRLNIMSYEKTIDVIKKTDCSIARFGDGEFDLILKTRDLKFQNQSDEIANSLEKVLENKNKKLIICIPRCLNTVSECNESAKAFWIDWGKKDGHHKQVVDMIVSHTGKNYRFGDSQLTRPYIDWKSSKRAEKTFPLLKSLWQNKNLLVVEGSQTRLGVGNDLFDNAKSVSRILAPAVGAFESIDKIEDAILKHHKDKLVIMALGPTATVLASELANKNVQALDLGNMDIEYEWFLSKATSKVAVKGKYTTEANDGRGFTECNDEKYLSEVIEQI